MANFIIMDNNVGLLQFSGEFETPMAALEAFDKEFGIDPNNKGLDVIADDYTIKAVTADQRKAVEDWQANGAESSGYPL